MAGGYLELLIAALESSARMVRKYEKLQWHSMRRKQPGECIEVFWIDRSPYFRDAFWRCAKDTADKFGWEIRLQETGNRLKMTRIA